MAVTEAGDTWALPGSEAAPEASHGAGSPLSPRPTARAKVPHWTQVGRGSEGPAWEMPNQTVEQGAVLGPRSDQERGPRDGVPRRRKGMRSRL